MSPPYLRYKNGPDLNLAPSPLFVATPLICVPQVTLKFIFLQSIISGINMKIVFSMS